MPPDPDSSTPQSSRRNWWARLAWFLGLWVAGVAIVFTVAYAIRLMIL